MKAIAAVLLLGLALAVPGAAQTPQDRAEAASCLSNLKQIAMATLMFSQDHKEMLPKGASFAVVDKQLQPYLKNEAITTCHATKKRYAFNTALSGVSLAKVAKPAEAPLYEDAMPHTDGMVAVAFVDGHVKRYKADE